MNWGAIYNWFAGTTVFALKDVVVPLGWPLLALAALLMMQKEVRSFLGRATRLPFGAEAEPPIAQDQPPPVVATRSVDHTTADPNLQLWREMLQNNLETRGLHNLTVSQIQEEAAKWIRIAACEVTYRIIFGSQLALLDFMNVNFGRVEKSQIQSFYEIYASKISAAGATPHPIEVWFQFLVSYQLVIDNGATVDLAPAGKAFLLYLTEVGISKEKHY